MGGLGMEDKENDLRNDPIVLQMTSLLYGWIKSMFQYQSHKHKVNYNKHLQDIFPLFLLNFKGSGLILCLPRCISV
jgi:hypothetical protein